MRIWYLTSKPRVNKLLEYFEIPRAYLKGPETFSYIPCHVCHYLKYYMGQRSSLTSQQEVDVLSRFSGKIEDYIERKVQVYVCSRHSFELFQTKRHSLTC